MHSVTRALNSLNLPNPLRPDHSIHSAHSLPGPRTKNMTQNCSGQWRSSRRAENLERSRASGRRTRHRRHSQLVWSAALSRVPPRCPAAFFDSTFDSRSIKLVLIVLRFLRQRQRVDQRSLVDMTLIITSPHLLHRGRLRSRPDVGLSRTNVAADFDLTRRGIFRLDIGRGPRLLCAPGAVRPLPTKKAEARSAG